MGIFERFEEVRPKKKSPGYANPDRYTELTGSDTFNGNLPGTDLYDDGLDERGKVARPSSIVGSGGTYMEDKGPQDDGVHRSNHDQLSYIDREVVIADDLPSEIDEQDDDEAARWLRENDPNDPNQGKHAAD